MAFCLYLSTDTSTVKVVDELHSTKSNYYLLSEPLAKTNRVDHFLPKTALGFSDTMRFPSYFHGCSFLISPAAFFPPQSPNTGLLEELLPFYTCLLFLAGVIWSHL